MDQHAQCFGRWQERALSRRAILRHTTAAAAGAVAANTVAAATAATADAAAAPTGATAGAGTELQPRDAIQSILDAMDRYPLVAIAESHGLQELHDVISALLFHPALPGKINDIVVEFGNARYQDLADRFVVAGQPVANADLQQIWRQNADPLWDAPIYAQLLRNVRAINWMLPPSKRIRVLLGSTPIDLARVRSASDPTLLRWYNAPWDAYYTGAVEREVLAKGRRALLIAGSGHLLRGLHADGDPHHLDAGALLAQAHPGKLFVVDVLILPPGRQRDAAGERLRATLSGWPRPALAHLAGTWLGATTQQLDDGWVNWGAARAVNPAAARYEAQADAILYLGPGELLTASKADPAIYHWGPYPAELRRLSPIVSQLDNQSEDLVAEGLRLAQTSPNWFAQLNG